MVIKKEKNGKKIKTKKKKKKNNYDESEDEEMYQKWKEFTTEFVELGEDGELPQRMCNHRTIMQPIPHNEKKDSRCCDLCDNGIPINWDHYYVCNCNGVRTDHCFDHTLVKI